MQLGWCLNRRIVRLLDGNLYNRCGLDFLFGLGYGLGNLMTTKREVNFGSPTRQKSKRADPRYILDHSRFRTRLTFQSCPNLMGKQNLFILIFRVLRHTYKNTYGAVIPKEMLARLKVGKGDTLFAVETSSGYLLTPYDPALKSSWQRGGNSWKIIGRRFARWRSDHAALGRQDRADAYAC
jgi:bifunctional DNA-binding transcriptional regulator/antitoxin component of YhaV-PrlF toxin-antitoxin module